jgi:hypothetical protein
MVTAKESCSFAEEPPFRPDDVVLPSKKSALNAGHNFVRATVEGICADPSSTKHSQIPLGVVFQPFFNEEVPRYEVAKPERCPRCLAYLNGMFRFEANFAICHLCGHRFQRNPDLYPTEPVYDIVISSATEYIRKRVDRLHYLLIIQAGFPWTQTVLEAVKAALPAMGSAIRIGFLVYDRTLWTVRTVKGGYKQKLEIAGADPSFLPLAEDQMFLSASQDTATIEDNIQWIQ